MKRFIYIIGVFFVVLMTSCQEQIPLVSPSEGKLLIESELTTNQPAIVKISRINGFAGGEKVFPTNLDVKLRVGHETEVVLEWDAKDAVYKQAGSSSLNIYSGEVFLYVFDEDGSVVKSTTFMPSTHYLTDNSSASVNKMGGMTSTTRIAEVSLGIENYNLNAPYYRLKAFIKRNGNLIPINFVEGKVDANAFCLQKHTDGVLVDASRIDPKNIQMKYEFSADINENIDQVFFSVETITMPTYRYNIWKSKSFQATGAEPVTSYTNIEDGFGYFGAFTPALDSIEVK